MPSIIGKKRKRCLIERLTSVPGRFGDPEAGTWAEVDTVWGDLQPIGALSGSREYLVAMAERAQADSMLTIRFRSDIDVLAKDRITIDGVVYDVRSHPQDPTGRKRWLAIFLRRGVRVDGG